MVAEPRANDGLKVLSDDEACELFDKQARELLGISGEEFLRKWDAGDYTDQLDDPDHPDVMRLAMLISFGRKHSR